MISNMRLFCWRITSIEDRWKLSLLRQTFFNRGNSHHALKEFAMWNFLSSNIVKHIVKRLKPDVGPKKCTWHVHASTDKSAKSFSTSNFCSIHTCNISCAEKYHKQAKYCCIATERSNFHHPETTPAEIKTDILRDFGIEVSYYSSWKGKELTSGEIHGSWG